MALNQQHPQQHGADTEIPPSYSLSREDELVNGVNTSELFTIPNIPPPSYRLPAAQALPKPFALPQLAKQATSPFARGWNAELETFDVTQAKWLEFVDGLSFAISSSAPLYVLNSIGKIGSWIPIVGAVSTAIEAGTRKGSKAASKSATDRYVTRANEAYFQPRGLKVQLMTGKALREYLDLPPLESISTSGSFANGIETVHKHVRIPVISGIAGGLLNVFKPVPEASTSSSSASGLASLDQDFPTRNVASVQSRIAAIDYDVPASLLPNKIGDKFARYTSTQELATARASDLRARQHYSMLAIARGEMSAHQWLERYAGAYPGEARSGEQDSLAHEARRLEQHYRRRGRDADFQRQVHREVVKDQEASGKLIWLVVMPAGSDNAQSAAASTSRASTIPPLSRPASVLPEKQ